MVGQTPEEIVAAKKAQEHLDNVAVADIEARLIKAKEAADALAEAEAKARYLRPNGGLEALQVGPGRYCPPRHIIFTNVH